MVIKSVNLETVCGITSTIPDNEYNEVAFARQVKCRQVVTDQRTHEQKVTCRDLFTARQDTDHQFYNVNDAMYLVDLPGYGYANANIEIKAKWGQMIENYLHTSKSFRQCFFLIDIRHEPSDNDIMMYDWMVNRGLCTDYHCNQI